MYQPAEAGSCRQAVPAAVRMDHKLERPEGSKAADKELPGACTLPAA